MVTTTATAETWKARGDLIKEKSAIQCQGSFGTMTFELVDNMFTGSNANGKMFTITVPPDGAIKHAYKSPTGANLVMVGNPKSRELMVNNTGYGCWWKFISE